ncbi:hypothetical protein F7725_026048, partial [Dissostichus mawsoni]
TIRRVEVVTLSPRVSVFKERWPDQGGVPTHNNSFTGRDFDAENGWVHTTSLQLMRAKGGDAGSRMRPLLSTIDEAQSIGKKGMQYLFQDSQDEHDNVMDQTMKVLVIHDARDRGPADVSIVIERETEF